MKTIKYLFLVSILFCAGCADFLDKAPLDSINTENFYKTEEDALAAINAAYQPMQWAKLYNMRIWTLDIMAGNSIVGAGGGTDGVETVDMANFVTTTDNAGVLDLWRGPAPGILRCNLVLENVPNITMNETLKDRILGEAYFLRANYYFIMVRCFGDVPKTTKALTAQDDLNPPRTGKDEIYEMIIEDLKEAIELLPSHDTYTGSDVGRASKGSALGLLAKVYLTLGKTSENYQQVVELCRQVTALGYKLNDNYEDNFHPLTKKLCRVVI